MRSKSYPEYIFSLFCKILFSLRDLYLSHVLTSHYPLVQTILFFTIMYSLHYISFFYTLGLCNENKSWCKWWWKRRKSVTVSYAKECHSFQMSCKITMSSYIHRVFTICHVYSAQLYVPFLKANLGQAVQEKIGENRCHHTQFHNCDPDSSFLHFNSLWVSLWSCWLGPPLTTLPFPTTLLKYHLIFILPDKSHSSHFIEKELGF